MNFLKRLFGEGITSDGDNKYWKEKIDDMITRKEEKRREKEEREEEKRRAEREKRERENDSKNIKEDLNAIYVADQALERKKYMYMIIILIEEVLRKIGICPDSIFVLNATDGFAMTIFTEDTVKTAQKGSS